MCNAVTFKNIGKISTAMAQDGHSQYAFSDKLT